MIRRWLPVVLAVFATRLIAQVPATAPAAFSQCSSCHMVIAGGKNQAGPLLHGIVGAPAARVAGYKYSSALAASGLRWDEKTLDAWIANPRAVVRGTRMIYGGEKDPAKRAAIIAWLKANSG